jgi:hypothetical protein
MLPENALLNHTFFKQSVSAVFETGLAVGCNCGIGKNRNSESGE